MKTDQGDAVETLKPARRKFRLKLFISLIAAFVVVLVAALFVPVMDGPHRRQYANEAVAVGRLRRLNTLQSNYAAAHPAKGFVCELAKLRATAAVSETYDPDEFLVTGTGVGYKFAVTGCQVGPDGVVTRYQVTAFPLEPGKSGFRAFCTDETGMLWYDPDGSAASCLASRRSIQ